MTVIWEGLPFLDVSGGLVDGRDGAVLVDTGTTPTEVDGAIAALRVPGQ